LPSSEALGGDQFWYTEGILSFMGYRVRQYGVIASHRQEILDYVFHEQLPRVNNGEYMRSWGAPTATGFAVANNRRASLYALLSPAPPDKRAMIIAAYIRRD